MLDFIESRSSTSIRRPAAITSGVVRCAGDMTTLLIGSVTCTFSSNSIEILERLTLTSPGAGVLFTNTGGSTSRGPPCGLPILAQAAKSEAATAATSQRILCRVDSFIYFSKRRKDNNFFQHPTPQTALRQSRISLFNSRIRLKSTL